MRFTFTVHTKTLGFVTGRFALVVRSPDTGAAVLKGANRDVDSRRVALPA
jgi:hypothetical protein